MGNFKNTYRYLWKNAGDIQNIRAHFNTNLDNTISFSPPRLVCEGTESGAAFNELFDLDVKIEITRERVQLIEYVGASADFNVIRTGQVETVATYNRGSVKRSNGDYSAYYITSGSIGIRTIDTSFSKVEYGLSQPSGKAWSNYYTAATPIASNAGYGNGQITINLPKLSQSELDSKHGWEYTIKAIPIFPSGNSSGMIYNYEARTNMASAGGTLQNPQTRYYLSEVSKNIVSNPQDIRITAKFMQIDMTVNVVGGYFITKGEKYSCYQLLRKALLTCDTHIVGASQSLDEYDHNGNPQPSLKHPIIISEKDENGQNWKQRLMGAKMQETIMEGKNLWEVMLQVGYYLHAIPYLEFSELPASHRDYMKEDDRFVLQFRQLGGTVKNSDDSTKITVFNSRNLSEYFTQYDSYVTNLFSPQNLVECWTVVKTSNPSMLVSNDTAEIDLPYAITELVEFDISYKINGVWRTKSALEYVFEKSIYDIIGNDDPRYIFPSKGSSLYFNLGGDKILGLDFVAPTKGGDTPPSALKNIVKRIFELSNVDDLVFNNLKFRIKFRTQDTARINQIRPDIQNFIRNSKMEKYPHHEQYYGQQDKIIDSERFSANLFGRLVRVGNAVYQMQEFVNDDNIKRSGELVAINEKPHYVMSIESEYYRDAIFQKVSYSQNFNQLANIVTIPSEPRFYEVSERSRVRREVRIMDFIKLSTVEPTKSAESKFISTAKFYDFIKGLLFSAKENASIPNQAYTRFKVDPKRHHSNANNEEIANGDMFPSSHIIRPPGGVVYPAAPSDHADVIVPLLHFPLHDGIVFAWDMIDNFKAGDFVDTGISGVNTDGNSYYAMQSMRYCDVFGRADIADFKLFKRAQEWTHEEAQALPGSPNNYIPAGNEVFVYIKETDSGAAGIAHDKDCREETSFNYQLNLLHAESEGGDDFITFPNLFGEKSEDLKMCLLGERVSMFNEGITSAPIVGYTTYSITSQLSGKALKISINEPPSQNGFIAGKNWNDVKAIALYEGDSAKGMTAYIVKNLKDSTTNSEKKSAWYVFSVFND